MVDDETAKVTRTMRIRAVSQQPKLRPPLALFDTKIEVRSSDEKGPLDASQNDTFINQLLQFAIYLDLANGLIAYKDAGTRLEFPEVKCILHHGRRFSS